jgi:hypothetical protein
VQPGGIIIFSANNNLSRRGPDSLASVLQVYASAACIIRQADGVKDALDRPRTRGTREDVERAITAVQERGRRSPLGHLLKEKSR